MSEIADQINAMTIDAHEADAAIEHGRRQAATNEAVVRAACAALDISIRQIAGSAFWPVLGLRR